MKGIIKKLFRFRGFGFIEPDEGDEEVFCYRSEINYIRRGNQLSEMSIIFLSTLDRSAEKTIKWLSKVSRGPVSILEGSL